MNETVRGKFRKLFDEYGIDYDAKIGKKLVIRPKGLSYVAKPQEVEPVEKSEHYRIDKVIKKLEKAIKQLNKIKEETV